MMRTISTTKSLLDIRSILRMTARKFLQQKIQIFRTILTISGAGRTL